MVVNASTRVPSRSSRTVAKRGMNIWKIGLAAEGVTSEVTRMSGRLETDEARATAKEVDDGLELTLAGVWQITAPRPSWTRLLDGREPKRVRVTVDEVEKWDTSLLLFLFEVQEWCRTAGAYYDTEALPEKIQTLLKQFVSAHETSVPFDRSHS